MNRNEEIRYAMYTVYMGLLMGVEIYRYDEEDIPGFMEASRFVIGMGLSKLNC